jgi:hypothetical protein
MNKHEQHLQSSINLPKYGRLVRRYAKSEALLIRRITRADCSRRVELEPYWECGGFWFDINGNHVNGCEVTLEFL